MIKYTTLISFLLISVLCYAQNDEKLRDIFDENSTHLEEYKGLELGFNITNVISRFVGNEPGTDAADFPFLMRYHFRKSALRIGAGANFSRSSFFDATTRITRETEERSGVISFGMERHINIKKRMSFYYGIDVFGAIQSESVTTSTSSDSKIAKDITRFGGGPFLGISYSINHRVRFHTETNLAAFYELSQTTEIIGGIDEPIADTDRLGGQITPPIALYINLKL